jgi:hypothetical protein
MEPKTHMITVHIGSSKSSVIICSIKIIPPGSNISQAMSHECGLTMISQRLQQLQHRLEINPPKQVKVLMSTKAKLKMLP